MKNRKKLVVALTLAGFLAVGTSSVQAATSEDYSIAWTIEHWMFMQVQTVMGWFGSCYVGLDGQCIK